LDQLTDYPPLSAKVATTSTSNNSQPISVLQLTALPPTDYALDLLSLKNEINQLKTIIVTAVELIKHDIVSLHNTHSTPTSNAMDTNDNHAGSDNMNAPPQPIQTQNLTSPQLSMN